MVAVAPALREFSAANLHRKHYTLPYHPGALKYFKDKKHRSQGAIQVQRVTDERKPPARRSTSPPRRRSASSPARRSSPPTASKATVFADQCPAGAAGRLRRALGAGRPAAGVQRLVLHRAAADGLPRPDAGARLHRRDAAQAHAPSIRPARSPSVAIVIYLVYRYSATGSTSRLAAVVGARRWRWPGPSSASRAAFARWLRLGLRHRFARCCAATSPCATRR